MKNNTLSVVLAVYNEEENIANCLTSVKNIANEIVIVDGGSKDKTVEIAKSYKAKVIQTSNPVNFHINKNKAIDTATKDWILQLDADEVLSDGLLKEIKEVINMDNGINGYWLPRSNFFLGRFLKKGGQYPDYTLRLYRRGKGRLPAQDVHEQAGIEGRVGYLKNDLLHLRDKKFSIYLHRFNKYSTLFALQLKQENIGINPFSFVNYFFIKPIVWFVKSYFRHRGYVDGFPGFIFAFFSSLRFPISYIKYWDLVK